MDEPLIALATSLAIGLLIGLERERNPTATAGARTFTLVALSGTLSTQLGAAVQAPWLVGVGLAAVAAMLIAANWRAAPDDDPGTTTVAAACVCYLLGALSAAGEPGLAGALGIAVTALLYFKPEIEALSSAVQRHEQVSILQFLVASFIVLPILPDQAYGPYAVLNPRNIWLMVVLISGIGLVSHVALRVVGERHGALLTGLLGGLVSSTATTVLYARRAGESGDMRRLAFMVVSLANLVPLARIALIAAVVAPAILAPLAPVLAGALAGGILALAAMVRDLRGGGDVPVPESRNPAELGVAMRFAALYALVLLAAAWMSDVAGKHGLYAAALATGLVDIDPIMLSALRLFDAGRLPAPAAVAALALAWLANLVFKLGVLLWHDRALALRVLWPLGAAAAGGALAYAVA